MTRAPFQVLVVCRRPNEESAEYLVLRRADMGVWQFVSGGGEGSEAPLEAALRETREETGIDPKSIIALSPVAYIPVEAVSGEFAATANMKAIPEYSFLAIVAPGAEARLSAEHTECRWCSKGEAPACSNGRATARRWKRLLH